MESFKISEIMEEEFLELNIGLNNNVATGDGFAIYLKDNLGANYNVIGNFVQQRQSRYQIEVGATLEETFLNLKDAFFLDYNNDFEITSVSSNLSLKTKKANWTHLNTSITADVSAISIIATPVQVIPFVISSIEFLEAATNKCSNVKVRITTTSNMTAYCINQLCYAINANVVEFDYFRGSTVNVELEKNFINLTRNINTPKPIEDGLNKVQLNFAGGTSGTTVNVIAPFASDFQHQYSLDGVNFQTSNSFAGLLEGQYTLYIKDEFGCEKSIVFSVLEDNFNDQYVFLSKENSFRFIDPKGNFETDENRTFCKSNAKLNYGFIQEFLNTDIITTQFKSNFETISVSITGNQTNQIDLVPINKITQNLKNKAKYNQVKKYKISNTQFGLYFEKGQILDYDTNRFIDLYDLNGGLPIWAKLGNVIDIEGTNYVIENIGFDEVINAEVLIFNGVASVLTVNTIVGCVYNIQEYEIFEFTVDLSLYLGKNISIEITNSDPNFGNYRWTSEQISVVEHLNNYLEIRYYNSNNTNVIYSTGIQHLLRLPYNTIKSNDSDSSENYKTDTNSHLLNSDIYEITDFEFMPLPLELYRKLKIALSMDSVFINEVGYTKNSEFNKENLGNTNLYKLTASMIKNGFVFNSNKNTNELIVDGNINIPGLIEITSDGYISL